MKPTRVILVRRLILMVASLAFSTASLPAFSTNSHPDIVWHHVDGRNAFWYFPSPPGNVNLSSNQFITTSTDPDWKMAGTGDFDHDGQIDILWRHKVTGENAIWFMHGTNATGALIMPSKDLDWRVGAVADLDMDGHLDLIWRNYASGENAVWFLGGEKGTNLLDVSFLPAEMDHDWRIATAGDFNHDGQPDLVWSKPNSGENAIWLMSGTRGLARQERKELPPFKDLDYRIVAAMDFNGDGETDLLIHHATLGLNVVWYMNGTTCTSNAFLTPALDPGWKVAGEEDQPRSWRLRQNSYWGIADDVLSASVSVLPGATNALITLQKLSEPEGFSNRFTLQRKLADQSLFRTIASGAGANHLPDPSPVPLGQRAEYRVFPTDIDPEEPKRVRDVRQMIVGIDLPPGGGRLLTNETRGKVVLLVDAKLGAQIESELNFFTTDLIGDGWKVIRHNISNRHDDASWRNNPPRIAAIKTMLNADFRAGARAVFIIGHVPIPYSGTDAPDAHPDHRGAWPSDVYYGDVIDDERWTDVTTQTQSAFPVNHNRPHDGKFDQNDFPSALEMPVGRIDFSRLPCLAGKSEAELTRQYLQKNHRYRHKEIEYPRRAMISGMFTLIFHPSAPIETRDIGMYMNALRNSSRLFGLAPESLVFGDAFHQKTPYLWAFVSGPGQFDRINEALNYEGYIFRHTAASVNDPLNEPPIAFSLLRASYMGDWNCPDNFVRATLATPRHGLATLWMGTTEVVWRLEGMALGETLGDALLRTVNEAPPDSASRSRFLSIHGDPTLRLHVTAPPTNLVRSEGVLTWRAGEPECRYAVYRSTTGGIDGDFVRLTPSAGVGETSFADPVPPRSGARLYEVRALKLENSGSGSYTNLSQGIFGP